MLNSTYAPQRWTDIEAAKVKPNAQGINFSAAANTTTDYDLLIPDDSLVRAIELFARTPTFNDSATIKIIDKDGVYFPANTVVATPVTNWQMRSDSQMQAAYESVAPTKIPGGLYFRISYTNISLLSMVSVEVNLILNTILM